MASSDRTSFRESVDIMYNRAAGLIDLSPGLSEKLGFVMQPTQQSLVFGWGAKYKLLLAIGRYIQTTWSQ